jgi:hypothetical protein
MAVVFFHEPWYLQRNKHLFSYEVPGFQILESEFQFSDSPDIGIQKKNPTGIFGIENRIGILLTMGVPEIGTKNWNSQPSERIHAYLMKLSNNIDSDFGLSYETIMNSQSYTIRAEITRPCQFPLGNIPTMSGITGFVGEDWHERKFLKIFNRRNNTINRQEEVAMTTSNQFEQAYIVLLKMTKIKLTTKKGKGNLFTIECNMPSFEPQNQSVCKHHATKFKNDKYTFNPWKDLVLSMLCQFVANLEPGQFTPLNNRWLKNLKRILNRQN